MNTAKVTLEKAPIMTKTVTLIHSKIGNGYGGFDHPANETACGLGARGRKMSFEMGDVTCDQCLQILHEQFGQ